MEKQGWIVSCIKECIKHTDRYDELVHSLLDLCITLEIDKKTESNEKQLEFSFVKKEEA